MEFEWDEAKRQKTLFERGIDFIDAALIWDDPLRQVREDTRRDYGEKRYQTIGRGPLGILFVVYTIRVYSEGKHVNRIISVRRAKKKDIEQYESRTFSEGLKNG
ncbi:BrnT family toxin [Marinobacteraceae bacterium S3BR75-40.1]